MNDSIARKAYMKLFLFFIISGTIGFKFGAAMGIFAGAVAALYAVVESEKS